MRAIPDVARATPTSASRERRLRSFFRHEQMAVQMAVVSAQHHSAQRCRSIATQTEDSLAATYAATAGGTAPAPVIEYVAPAPAVTFAAPAPVIEIVAPAPAVTYTASVLLFEYVAPAPVIEYIAPAPAVTSDIPTQQLPPVYTTTTVTTDDNLDMTSLVYPQFSSTAVEPYAPRIVGSLPPLEEFSAPGYNPVHHEQIVAGEMTQNIIGNFAVQEQIIVPGIPPVVERIQEQIVPDHRCDSAAFTVCSQYELHVDQSL